MINLDKPSPTPFAGEPSPSLFGCELSSNSFGDDPLRPASPRFFPGLAHPRSLSGMVGFRLLSGRRPSPGLISSLGIPGFVKILVLALVILIAAAAEALAVQPLDLAELGRRGISQKSRDIIVTQALTVRARPPLEIGVVIEMAAYGGDDLARAYLEMDAATNQSPVSPLPPQSVRNLMTAGISSAEIKDLIKSAAEESAASNPAPAVALAPGPIVNETVETVAYRPAVSPEPPKGPSEPSFAEEDIAPPQPLQNPYAAVKEAIIPSAPAAPGIPAVRPPAAAKAPPTPAELRKIPQTLAPGQSADPARPLPVAPGPYWTREPEPGKHFMGVTDEVKDDGHRYEVHANAREGLMGQEVLSRASGHKVVRHYNGTERIEGPVPPQPPEPVDDDYYNGARFF